MNHINQTFAGKFTYNSLLSKNVYHVLGEQVEVKTIDRDLDLITNISILNILGKPFLEELHKNEFRFPTEIEEYLEKKFKYLDRDKKISDIIS